MNSQCPTPANTVGRDKSAGRTINFDVSRAVSDAKRTAEANAALSASCSTHSMESRAKPPSPPLPDEIAFGGYEPHRFSNVRRQVPQKL